MAVWLDFAGFCLQFLFEAAAVDSLGRRIEPLEDEPPLLLDSEEYQAHWSHSYWNLKSYCLQHFPLVQSSLLALPAVDFFFVITITSYTHH